MFYKHPGTSETNLIISFGELYIKAIKHSFGVFIWNIASGVTFRIAV